MNILRVELCDTTELHSWPQKMHVTYIIGYPDYVGAKVSQYMQTLVPNIRIVVDAFTNWDTLSYGGGISAERLLEIDQTVYDVDPALLEAAKETVRKALRRERARIDKDLEKLS